MPLFKRDNSKVLIPPVDSTRTTNSSSPRPGFRSNASSYVASRDGDLSGNRYSPAAQPPDDPVESANRQALMGDYVPRPGRSEIPDEPGDDDIEGIKQQTRFIKQESVHSTRNALRLAREAEETARNTLTRLGDQSEKLANTERHLDVAKGHSARAQDKTDELKQLNRSIFRPVITFNKDKKRAAQDAKALARYEEEREEREKAMMDVRETQNRLGRAATYGRDGDDEEGIGLGRGRGGRSAEQNAARKEGRKRFQFEATASDDELEDELDDNLDDISQATRNLKILGEAMGQELDNQNARIGRIENKTTALDDRVHSNTLALKKIN